MKSGTNGQIILKDPRDANKEIIMNVAWESETQFVIVDYKFGGDGSLEDDLKANTVIQETYAVGQSVAADVIQKWAQSNEYTYEDEAVDGGYPVIISESLNTPTDDVVTVTFNQNIDLNVADNAALKALIEWAANGSTFIALGGADAVSTPDGTGNTMTITFDTALTLATNAIRFLVGGIKGVDGKSNAQIDTLAGAIDAV